MLHNRIHRKIDTVLYQVHKTRTFKPDAVYREQNPSIVLVIERRLLR